MKPTTYIWHKGRMVPWADATVHVLAHALHYGSSVFEGIRAYDTPKGVVIFRLQPHIRRLFDSAKIYRMDIPHTAAEISEACRAVVRDNGLKAAYLRPVAYRGYGTLGVAASDKCPVEVAVAAFEWGAYLGPEALEQGVDVAVSSWQRVAPNTLPAMAKAAGNYLSSQLISMEARRHGYEEGIALDSTGNLSEGAGENLFLIRDGIIFTPPLAAALLNGITRDSVMVLAKTLGYEVREQTMPREALYLADEIFLTGTAAEISPVKTVDGITVGEGRRGPMTAALQKAFFGLFNGQTDDRWGWLEAV